MFPPIGFIEWVSKDVSLFNLKCMLAIFGACHTRIHTETNVAVASTSIDKCAGVKVAVKDRLIKIDHTIYGDPIELRTVSSMA